MPPESLRQKLLVVSHACVTPVNQLLFCAMEEAFPHLEITLLVPANWKNEYTGKLWQVEAHPAFNGKIVTLPVAFSGHISLHFYGRGISELLTTEQPDWIYLDEEPWALVTQQVARINASTVKAPFLFHTNQNLMKHYPFPFSYCEKWIYRNASHALPVGEEAARVLREKGYANPLTVFPYGIDPTLYYPRVEAASFREKLQATDTHMVFGYLGRFVEEKGLQHLISGFAQVLKVSPQAMLWLIGSGPEEQKLRNQAQALGLKPPQIQFLPSIKHHEAPIALSAMDVIVLPSLTRPFWKEQFGRVIIEAMACGTPVIGSDSGEIPHLIGKLSGGLVFPEGQVEALAQAMNQLIINPAYTKTLGEHGKTAVLAGYTNSQLARGFYQVLQTLR